MEKVHDIDTAPGSDAMAALGLRLPRARRQGRRGDAPRKLPGKPFDTGSRKAEVPAAVTA
jgi:hypothetical protein